MAKYVYKKQGDTPAAHSAPGEKRLHTAGDNPPPVPEAAPAARPGRVAYAPAAGPAAKRPGKNPLPALAALLGCWLAAAAALAALYLFAPPQAAPPASAGPTGQQADTPAPDTLYTPLEKHALDTRPVVVLDAGHGGETPFGYESGAVDPTGGWWESVITDIMVQRVTALLEQHPDEIKVVRSVAADTYASSLERANTAVRHRASLMLSLHLNADYYPYNGRGFSCFPSPPGRIHHEESVRFSRLLIDQVRPTGIPVMGDNGVFYHYYFQQPYGGFSKYIIDSADQTEPWPDESFGVVEYAGCPSVLVEQWFITSGADMALFNHEEGYDTMARCIYLAICAYFDIAPI